jgi:hypothetical protein
MHVNCQEEKSTSSLPFVFTIHVRKQDTKNVVF